MLCRLSRFRLGWRCVCRSQPLYASINTESEKIAWGDYWSAEQKDGLEVASRIILQKMNTRVINVLTLQFISFVIYSSFNFSHSCLSYVTLGYSKADTKSRFQLVFSSDVDFNGTWNRTFDHRKHTAYMQFSSQLGWVHVDTDLTFQVNDEIIIF